MATLTKSPSLSATLSTTWQCGPPQRTRPQGEDPRGDSDPPVLHRQWWMRRWSKEGVRGRRMKGKRIEEYFDLFINKKKHKFLKKTQFWPKMIKMKKLKKLDHQSKKKKYIFTVQQSNKIKIPIISGSLNLSANYLFKTLSRKYGRVWGRIYCKKSSPFYKWKITCSNECIESRWRSLCSFPTTVFALAHF